MRTAIVAIVWILNCGPVRAEPAVAIVERDLTLIESEGKLAQSVGIETLGGVFTPLLEAGCKLPCATTKTFSTASDGQKEITIHLFRGPEGIAKRNHALGTYVIANLPEAKRGVLMVSVTVRADERGIVLEASEASGKTLEIKRSEGDGETDS